MQGASPELACYILIFVADIGKLDQSRRGKLLPEEEYLKKAATSSEEPQLLKKTVVTSKYLKLVIHRLKEKEGLFLFYT